MERIAIIVTVLSLLWQTRALTIQIARAEMQSVYDRYLEITKIEIDSPVLHKMFLYGRDFDRFSGLSDEELHYRALSLLILDQFAYLFNMSGQPTFSRLARWVIHRFPWLERRAFIQNFLDRRRTIWEINADYVAGVLTNPWMIRSWRDWGLGETWAGSKFYEFVEETIDKWQAKQVQPGEEGTTDDNGSTE